MVLLRRLGLIAVRGFVFGLRLRPLFVSLLYFLLPLFVSLLYSLDLLLLMMLLLGLLPS